MLALLDSCSAPDDTRANVPVVMGLRLESDADPEVVLAGIPAIRKTGANEILIEFPLRAVSANDPSVKIDSFLLNVLDVITTRLDKEGFKISIAICNSRSAEVFVNGKSPDPEIWFRSLENFSDTLLKKITPVKIQRLIYGKNLMITEFEHERWNRLFDSMRKKYQLKVSYAADADRFRRIIPLAIASDEIAICYQSRNPERMIEYNREVNHALSELADSLQKPVFIFQANLLGKEPGKIFEYRLKFWNEQTRLEGITINSLYPRFAVNDTFVYYGLAKEKEFLQYLENYVSGK